MRHNTPESLPRRMHLVTLIEQLRQVERMLIRPQGATIAEIADDIERCDSQARRSIQALRALGVPVTDDYVPGNSHPAKYRLRKSKSLFR